MCTSPTSGNPYKIIPRKTVVLFCLIIVFKRKTNWVNTVELILKKNQQQQQQQQQQQHILCLQTIMQRILLVR